MLVRPDVQVWLDTQYGPEQAVIVPYVQSEVDARLQYRVDLVQQGGSGTSRLSQAGRVELTAGEAAPLSRLAVSSTNSKACTLEVVLRDHEKELGRFSFDCAPPR